MKYLLMLAAAASLAACASRSEDEVGAAPDQGDTTAVVADTSTALPTDTTMGQTETDTSYVGQDTTATPTPGDSALVDDQLPDTTGAAPTDTSTGEWTDTTSTTGQDTSSMGTPADSAPQPGQ